MPSPASINTLRQNRPMLHPCMTRPPSTLRACPVMYAERGDTRNPITPFRQLHTPQRDLAEAPVGELLG